MILLTQLLKSTHTTHSTRNICSGIKETVLGIIYSGSSRSIHTCPLLMTCFKDAALSVAAFEIENVDPYEVRLSRVASVACNSMRSRMKP